MQKTKERKSKQVENQTDQNRSGAFGKWFSYLLEPIDGASLAIFRICFGLTMIAQAWHSATQIHELYGVPRYFCTFIPELKPLPEAGMYAVFMLVAAMGALTALGVFYRAAVLVMGIAWTYTWVIEKAYFQNHYYLISLLCLLFFLMPLDRLWSFESSDSKAPRNIPRWSLIVLRAQILLVYFFGGIAKLNEDWLRGEPIASLFKMTPSDFFLAPLFTQPWFPKLIAYGGIAVDLSTGFLLWWPPTFWLGAAIATAFHCMNEIMFSIGVFPYLMLCTIGLYAKPDWPRRVYHRMKYPGVKFEDAAKESLITGADYAKDTRLCIAILVFLHIYFIAQLLIPLRCFLYPGNVCWTDQGFTFSWRMMLRQKIVKTFEIKATNPKTGADIPVRLSGILNSLQSHELMIKPEMIIQFAHKLADSIEHKKGVRPIIKVTAVESMNCRAFQNLIDPNVDLAAQPINWLPKPWVVPLMPLNESELLKPEQLKQLKPTVQPANAIPTSQSNRQPFER